MNGKRVLAGSAVLVAGALALSACAGGGGDSGSDGDVTMTFWHNSTTGPGKQYWEDTVAAFEEANPGVTIEIQSVQNEEMDGKLQTALNSGDAPDIFMARGGGKLADVVAAGQAMDLTERHHRRHRVRAGRRALRIRGRRQGLRRCRPPCSRPASSTAGDAFEAAGVTPPATIDELVTVNDALRATGIAPIAVGAKDAWPAAHWYYNFALRACAKETMDEAAVSRGVQRPVLARSRREPAGVPGDRAVQRRLPHDRRTAGCRLVRRSGGQPPGGDGAHGRLGPGCDRVADARREAAARPRCGSPSPQSMAATASPAP